MTLSEYNLKKEEQKNIWLAKVFSLTMGLDEQKLYKEAVEKFEAEYPKFIN